MDGRRGQSETLGYALIIGFTLISVGAIAAFGGTTLQSTQQQIGTQTAENAMSQFDSRASMVALGVSDSQHVSLGDTRDGTYSVDPTAGWLRIIHENETDGNTTELYNTSLGAVHYRNGDTELGYQAGGLWRQDASSVMVSPPEFRYRGSTLTLPLIKVKGDGKIGGRPTGQIRTVEDSTIIYPNASRPTPNTNPVESGSVIVTVQSEYYDAWGRFFESRTDGNVSVDESNRTASVELIAPATQGDFEMPAEGDSVTFQGLQTHQLDDFTLTLFSDTEDNAKFNNLKWSIYATSGTKKLQIWVTPESNTNEGSNASLTVYYSPDSSNHQTWNTKAFTFEEEDTDDEDWNDDGDSDDKRLVLNLTGTEQVEYGDYYDSSIARFDKESLKSHPKFDEHEAYDENVTYSDGTTKEIGYVVNHYLALMGPTVDLTVQDKSSDTVSERMSTGSADYNASDGRFLTYMHVTENPVNVTLSSG